MITSPTCSQTSISLIRLRYEVQLGRKERQTGQRLSLPETLALTLFSSTISPGIFPLTCHYFTPASMLPQYAHHRHAFQVFSRLTITAPRRRAALRPISTRPEEQPLPNSSRWLPDIKARLGKCITFGLKDDQIGEAGRIARILGEEWKGLVVGHEGFVLRDGLEAAVRWGEMVSRHRPMNGTIEGGLK